MSPINHPATTYKNILNYKALICFHLFASIPYGHCLLGDAYFSQVKLIGL